LSANLAKRQPGASSPFAGFIVLAIAGGVCVLLYHYWKLALAFLVAAVVFACGLSRAAMFAAMCALLVALAILGNSARAEAVADGDAIGLSGTAQSLWGMDAAEIAQMCKDGCTAPS
jgi:hypothetical protein